VFVSVKCTITRLRPYEYSNNVCSDSEQLLQATNKADIPDFKPGIVDKRDVPMKKDKGF